MNHYEKKQMGLRIKKLREAKGLTQDDLAEKLNMKNRATISSYEAGRSIPPSDVLRDLADIFGVTTDFLLGRGDTTEIELGAEGIGWAIKEERLSLGMTQRELGDLIGEAQRKISQYELDLIPVPSDTAEKIAHAFGMSLPSFLDKYNLFDEHISPEFESDVDKHLAFEKAKAEDAMRDPGYEIHTIAAHHDGDDWTDEELEEIERFKEFVRSKRKRQE